jgi:cytochrome P450
MAEALRERSIGETGLNDFDPSSAPLNSLDLTHPDLFRGDNHVRLFDRLRKEDPVYFQGGSRTAGAFWNITRYADVMSVDTNHTVFSSRNSSFMEDMPDDFVVSMFLAMDPPRHTTFRDALRPAFSTQHLSRLEETIRTRTRAILDALTINEEFDWIDRVSIDLTSHVLATLFEFPSERRHKLIEWSDLTVQKTHGNDGEIVDWTQRKESFMECLREFNAIKAERSAGERTDLVSLLANSHGGKALKPSEFLGNLLMLMFAGNDTTRNSISGSVVAFDRFPDQLRRLRENPDLLGSAVQEVFRWQSPVAYMRRVATVDTEMSGKRIKAGDKVVIWYASGNRDSSVFANPHDFDIKRHNVGKHLAFGYGVHRCIGLRLADLQLRILWQEILDRYESIEVIGEPAHVRSTFIKGYTKLRVKVHARTSA